MWGCLCSPGQVSRLVVRQGAIPRGFLAPAAGLASPRRPHPSWQSVFDGDQWVGTGLFLSGGGCWHFRPPIQQQNLVQKLVLCQMCISQPHSSQRGPVFFCPLCPLRWVPTNGMWRAHRQRSFSWAPVSHGAGAARWSRARCCSVSVQPWAARVLLLLQAVPWLQGTLLQSLETSPPG